jgi:hypothetical protein
MAPSAFTDAGISGLRVIYDMLSPQAEGKARRGTADTLREGQASSLVNSGQFRKDPGRVQQKNTSAIRVFR